MSATAELPAPAPAPLSAAAPYTPPTEAEKAERERKRAEAERWLASLPIAVVRRPASEEHPHSRLVMYRTAASTPEFWEKTWLVSPSFRMRGYKIGAYYQDLFLRLLPRDGLIVEAGCGNGNLLRMVANDGDGAWKGKIEGLDFAADAIAANQRIDPEGRYRVGDVRELPYADDELAGYLSLGVVEHFNETDRAVILREAARCLRPGGMAFISVPAFSPARRIKATLGAFEDESTIARRNTSRAEGERALDFYQFYFTLKEFRRQITAAGLEVVEVDGYDVRRGWTEAFGCEGFIKWLEQRGPAWARWVEHPTKILRRFSPHMMMVVCRKPSRN